LVVGERQSQKNKKATKKQQQRRKNKSKGHNSSTTNATPREHKGRKDNSKRSARAPHAHRTHTARTPHARPPRNVLPTLLYQIHFTATIRAWVLDMPLFFSPAFCYFVLFCFLFFMPFCTVPCQHHRLNFVMYYIY